MDIFRLAITKKVVKDDSVGEVVEEYAVANIDSAVGTWVFNKSVSKFDSVVEFGITGTATSGDYTVNVRSIKNGLMSGGASYYIVLTESSWHYFRSYGAWEYYDNKWYNIDTPPTLVITGGDDVSNPEFLEWLRNNATLQIEEIPENATKIIYDGSVVASLEPGQTETIPCAGKKMRTNITVQVSKQEASGGGVEIPLRTIPYEVREGFNTVVLKFLTVEDGTLVTKSVEASANSSGSLTFFASAGLHIESTEATDSWGTTSYPSISVDDTGGYFVGEQGTNASMIYIPAVSCEYIDNLIITASGAW